MINLTRDLEKNLTAQQKRSDTINAKKAVIEAIYLEELQAVQALEQAERNAAFDALEALAKQADHDYDDGLSTANIDALAVAIDRLHYECDTRTGVSIKRADINIKHRITRLIAFKALKPDALEFLSTRLDCEEFDRQIYAQDKVRQFARYLSGDDTVFNDRNYHTVSGQTCNNGRLKSNNTLLMTVKFLQSIPLNTPLKSDQNGNVKMALENYGQPCSSSSTQAGSSLRALSTLGYIKAHGGTAKKADYYTMTGTVNELFGIFKNTHMHTLTELSRK